MPSLSFLRKKILGAHVPHPCANIHKKSVNLSDSYKKIVNAEMNVKNCVSVNEGFLILYGDPYKVFEKKNSGASSVISMG